MRVDLCRQLQFPGEITSLRPDIVVWSTKARAVLLIKLTVPWEEGLPSNKKNPSTQNWLLSAGRPAGGPTSTQWRSDAEALWGCQPHAC